MYIIDKILNSAFVQQDIIGPLENLGGFIAGTVDCAKFLDSTPEEQQAIKAKISNYQDQPCEGQTSLGAYIPMKLLAVASPLIPLFTNIAGIKANLAEVEKIAQTEVTQAFKDKAMNIVNIAEQFGKNFLELFNCYQQVHDKYEANQQFGPAWRAGFNCSKGNLEEVGDVSDVVLSAAYDFMFELNQWALQEHGQSASISNQHSELFKKL